MSDNGHTAFATGKNLFRIGEVSRLTDTKPFVLRYWESEFPMLQPVKSPKGHRLYRREDIDTVRVIRRLLYDEGFTIAGARRHLRENGATSAGEISPSEAPQAGDNAKPDDVAVERQDREQFARAAARGPASPTVSRKVLLDLRDSLREFLTLLESE